MLSSSPQSAERLPIRGMTLADLDTSAFETFLRERLPSLCDTHSSEELAVQVGLAVPSGSGVVPTAAALLLFGRIPQLLNPQWGVLAVRFEGTRVTDPVASRQDLEGPLGSMLEGALAFVRESTLSAVDQLRPDVAASEYSEIAVREALTNALVHRDLRHSARVALHLFDDRLVIRSPGGLPSTLPPPSELDLEGGVSVPRNPILASTARRLGIGEQIGRGLALIRREVSSSVSGDTAVLVATQHEVCVRIPSALRGPGRSQRPG